MAGPVKTLLIGASLLVIVMLGGFNFMVESYDTYGISSNSSAALNTTRNYMNTINSTTTDYSAILNANNIEFDVLALLGVVFRGLGTFVLQLVTLPGLFISMLTGFQQNSPLFTIPDEFITMIGGIITITLIISGIAILIARNSDDI